MIKAEFNLSCRQVAGKAIKWRGCYIIILILILFYEVIYIYVFSISFKFKLSACVFLLTKYLSNTSLQMILTSCSIYIIMSKWSQPVISLRIILLLSCFSVFTDSHDKSRQLLNVFSISFSLLKLYQFSPTIVWARHFKFGLKD